VTVASLAKEDLLTVAPPPGGYQVPGDELDLKALGFLHANCGHCHNATGVIRPNPIFLRVLVGHKTIQETDVFKTSVGKPHSWEGLSTDVGILNRIEPGNSARSELVYRLRLRGAAQMPPIATKLVDERDIGCQRQWLPTTFTSPRTVAPNTTLLDHGWEEPSGRALATSELARLACASGDRLSSAS
jgi:hypothetical protein